MRGKWGVGKSLLLCLVLVRFDTLAAAPQTDVLQLTAVEPKSGVTTPGSRVTIYGTGFSPDAVVYFGGLQVRDVEFLGPSKLEVVTPYLRPGTYRIQLKSGGIAVRSDVNFTALPSLVDSEIDRAVALAGKGQAASGIAILTGIAKENTDYQVRAFAYYQIGQIYFARGDFLRWSWTTVFVDSDKSGMAVQTSWRYRLDAWRIDYLFNLDTRPDYDLKLADWTVKYDVTQNPEPRFYRALVNARYGNLEQARIDTESILAQDPRNPSYRALAAYVAVLGGDKTQIQSFSGENIADPRALRLLGEAAYLSGDSVSAQRWWMLAANEYPQGAALAFLAGKKHFVRGQKRVAEALLMECVTMAPNSKEAKNAQDLLATLRAPDS